MLARYERLWLAPASHIKLEVLKAERRKWTAQDSNARFSISRSDAATPVLAAGWYRLKGSVRVFTGTLAAPCFSLVYASGPAEPMRIRIGVAEPNANGQIDALVLFTHDVAELSFHPSARSVAFTMEDFELRKLQRAEWICRLIVALHRGAGVASNLDVRGMFYGIAKCVLRGDLRQAAELLTTDYLKSTEELYSSYQKWLEKYDTIDASQLRLLSLRGQKLAEDGPTISLLLPVYQTPERYLRRCIESVLNQAYPRWQLCVADDASPDGSIRSIVAEYAARDARIRFVFREMNGHISEASNSALLIAEGEFIGFLDHDDELRPHALLEVVEKLRCNPDAGLIYSDEDKIDAEGRRFDPYFKPDWNLDLLRSQNFLCHFTVIRADLVREVGGFRAGFEGSQDHDLFLRCVEKLPQAQILHIPKVLYHWRAIVGSTALGHQAKGYAAEAGRRAVNEHFERIGSRARVTHVNHGHYRANWPIQSPVPKVSILIPTRDRVELLRACVHSVFERTDYSDFEVVIIDNQSQERETLVYLEEMRHQPRVRVLRYDKAFNYSAINNWAAGQCDGQLLCLMNNDIEVLSGNWLEEMAGHALRPDVGAVGAMLYYPDQTIQHAGVILGIGGVANHAYLARPRGYGGHGGRARVVQNLSAVTGACLVVRRSTYTQLGGLDERLQVAFNDVDFCLRLLEAGYVNVWTPFAELYHHESASRGAEDSDEKIARFHGEVRHMEERWAIMLAGDPAYNPNLSLAIEHCSFELAFPPRSAVEIRARNLDGGSIV